MARCPSMFPFCWLVHLTVKLLGGELGETLTLSSSKLAASRRSCRPLSWFHLCQRITKLSPREHRQPSAVMRGAV